MTSSFRGRGVRLALSLWCNFRDSLADLTSRGSSDPRLQEPRAALHPCERSSRCARARDRDLDDVLKSLRSRKCECRNQRCRAPHQGPMPSRPVGSSCPCRSPRVHAALPRRLSPSSRVHTSACQHHPRSDSRRIVPAPLAGSDGCGRIRIQRR
jgi:hypothetical protein